MNIIIKIVQIAVVLIAMNEGARAETVNVEGSTGTGTEVVNQAAKNFRLPKKNESFSFIITAHQGDVPESYRVLDKKGLVSAHFKLSRSLHNRHLKIIDSEASNEYMRASMMIPLDSVPTIENYLQFFTQTGYFSVDK